MLAVCAVMLAASNVFGLGSDFPNDETVGGTTAWPNGMKHLVNTSRRVHGYFADDEDVFFFSGNAADFSAFLLEYSKIDPVQKHVLVIHGGPGIARSPWGNAAGVPCAWELYGRAAMQIRKDINAPALYVLEVHFWSGGKIDLKQVTVPKNIELRMAE